MTGQQLKNSILQMAIQGKLVPQDPYDEPASVLLDKIRKEKARLVKEGKLKKKDLEETPISPDEIPFDAPDSWVWCRLIEIALDSADGPFGSNLKKEHYTERKEVRIIQLSNIGEFGWKDANVKYTTFEYLPNIARSEAFAGDIIIAKMMPAGRAIICPDNDIKYVLSSDAVRFNFSSQMYKPFLYYAINSPVFKEQVYGEVQGITRVRTSLNKLRTYMLPIPPLAEQQRIVRKIEELMPKVDEYNKSQEALNELNASIPNKLRQSILQEAIQGHLMPQDPNDEPASVLLDKIRKEKARLVKEGKLKKKDLEEKPISPEEIPFDIPDGWTWCRLSNFLVIISGTSYNKGDVANSGIRILRGGNIQNNKLTILDDDVFVPLIFEDEEKNIKKNDIIIVASTGSMKALAKPAFIDKDYLNTQIGAFLRILRPIDITVWPYICNIINSSYFHDNITNQAKGVNINNIKNNYINEMLIPLPPLSEQQRIVAKIEELMPKIDRLVK